MDKILIIDDDDLYIETLSNFLSRSKIGLTSASNGALGLELISKEKPDVVLTCLKIQGYNGIEILKKIKKSNYEAVVIIVTEIADVETTIQAMQLGAYDCIEKSEGLEQIGRVINTALKRKKLNNELIITIPTDIDNDDSTQIKRMVGQTPVMNDIFKKIGKVSLGRVSVLIQGESGTGKEIIAKIIHYSGITKHLPFVAVNCSALSESLLESELFGHVKGAFTGSIRDKKGKFELAGKGTIFLDEISELSMNLQVKLLRIIQEREFEKVGGENTIPMNARIIAATNRDLKKMMKEGNFREDLYYRLDVFPINVPPLRERKNDIPLLVVHFLQKINRVLNKNVCKVPFEIIEYLQNYEWPGNVRELENTLLEAVVLAQDNVLEKRNIKFSTVKQKGVNFQVGDEIDSLAEIEKKYIKSVLDKLNWDKKAACQSLGIAKTTLYNKISYYNLSR